MLKILRKKGVMKKIIWGVVIVIIIAFGFGGTLYLLNDAGSTSYAGKIFGQKISFDDFEKVYRDVRIQAIMRYGDNFRNIQQYLNLENETWDRLILLHEVKKRRIKASDVDVVKHIEQYPFFQKDNQFDPSLYNNILQYLFRIKPRYFEESIRDIIKLSKLYDQETSSTTIPENEIFESYKKQNEKVQISYVFISPEQFKDGISFNEEKNKTYYDENKIEFLLPPSINVNYININFPEPTPIQEIESPDDTPTDEQPEPALSEEIKAATEKTANTIYKEILINPDLETAAKRNNLKVQTSGFFSMENPNLSLGWSYEALNKIFQLDTSEISDLLETPKGYFIIQVKEKKETYVPEYAEAKEKVWEAVVKKETKIIAQQKAKESLTLIHQELDKSKLRDFPKAAKTLGLEIVQTPIFNRGQYLPKIGPSKEFQEASFQLNDENKVSDVVDTENGYCILHLDAYIPVEDEDYQKSKVELTENLLNERKNKIFNDFLTNLRTAAQLEKNISKLKEK